MAYQPRTQVRVSFVFFFSRYGDHRDLHSFPTLRSSDLASALAGELGDQGAGVVVAQVVPPYSRRSEEHTSELSHSSNSYAVLCLKKKKHRSEYLDTCWHLQSSSQCVACRP